MDTGRGKKTIFLLGCTLVVLAALASQQVGAEEDSPITGQHQQLFPLTDREIGIIRTLRAGESNLGAPYHQNQASSRMAMINNGPDVALVLIQPAARVNNKRPLSRLQRSLKSLNSVAPVQFPAPQGSPAGGAAPPKQLQIYQDEQAFKRQLPDLIAQAHTDKALERALLRILINTSLTGQAGSSLEPPSGVSEGDNNLASLKLQQQRQLDSYADSDPFMLLDGGGPEQAGILANNLDKRESKPCLFNAIDCLRSPYGRNSEI